MAFGTELHLQPTNAGELRGKRFPIGCQCWFSTKGEATPIMIRYEDENQMIHTIDEIEIKYQQQRNFNGLATVEFGCNLVNDNRKFPAKLLFLSKDNKWIMTI
ncbi:MAG: hypothetical protein R3Y54_08655 [Eubacteriales bacterium]